MPFFGKRVDMHAYERFVLYCIVLYCYIVLYNTETSATRYTVCSANRFHAMSHKCLLFFVHLGLGSRCVRGARISSAITIENIR